MAWPFSRKQPRNPGSGRPGAGFITLEPRLLYSATTAIADGSWDDPAVWDNGVPDASLRAIIASGTTVDLDGLDHVAKQLVVHGNLRAIEAVDPTETRTLTSDWIHVNSGGVFQIGTEQDRYDTNTFVVTLTGDDPDADFIIETATGTISVTDNNAFIMAAGGGRLQFFGEQKLGFTKLAQTAEAGAGSIYVRNVIERNHDGTTSAASDGTLDWGVGDQIVIASSSYNYAHEEVRTITSIIDTGDGRSLLVLDSPLSHRHYGEIETYGNGQRTWDIDMRAEVALLNRSIRFQGDENADTDTSFGNRARWNNGTSDGIGGHLMVMGSAGQITLDGVQFDRMGQTGTLGRYPVHWHVAGNRGGDVLVNSSITNSNNRGVTVHGTQNLLLQDNVLHDIHGHGFFMEDAAEFGNQFLSNIVLGIHRVGGALNVADDDPFVVPGITRGSNGKVNGTAARGSNAEGSHDEGQQVSDRFKHSSAYWITNPDNTWVGNISAGSEGTGFWFALPTEVIGLSKDTGLYNGYNPLRTNLDQFDHNTTHSSPIGLTFDRGQDILNKGPTPNHYDPPQLMQTNFYTAYKHDGSAVYHRGPDAIFNESRFADNRNSSFNTFSQQEVNVLFVGHSRGNADLSKTVSGYRLYDGPGQIRDAHFAGFAADNAHTFNITGGARKHSHTRASGISYEADGTADNLTIDWWSKAAISNNQSPGFVAGRPDSMAGVILDVDGSLTGHAVGGGAGHVLTPKLDIYRDETDATPAGWNAYISDDRYAQLIVGTNNDQDLPDYRITNSAGHAFLANRTNLNDLQRQYVKVNAGEYTIEYLGAIPSQGLSYFLQVRRGSEPGDHTIFRIKNIATTMKPTTGTEVGSIQEVRDATSNTFYRDANGDLWWKLFQSSSTRQVRVTSDPPIPPTQVDQSPFGGSPRLIADDRVLEFEHFDEGGQGVAYSDSSSTTNGAPTRDTGVDGGVGSGASGEYIGWIADGEWLEYTVDTLAGSYDLTIRYASGASSPAGDVRLLIGDGPDGSGFTELGVFDLQNTGGWANWQTLTLEGIELPAGSGKVLRAEMIDGRFNLDNLAIHATELSPGETGTLSLPAADDAYIDAFFGIDNDVLNAQSGVSTSYLKFDLTGLEGLAVTSARLELTGGSPPSAAVFLAVHNGDASEWSAQTLNAFNAPGPVTQLDAYGGSVGAGQVIDFDVTAGVSLASPISFILSSTGGTPVGFGSSESPDPPRLVVEYVVLLPGDADGDLDVDDTDLGIAIANFTGPVGATGGKSWQQGDTDGDGDVDDTDLGVAIAGFTGPLAPALEPSPLLAAPVPTATSDPVTSSPPWLASASLLERVRRAALSGPALDQSSDDPPPLFAPLNPQTSQSLAEASAASGPTAM